MSSDVRRLWTGVELVTEPATAEAPLKVGLEAIQSGTGKFVCAPGGDYQGTGLGFRPGDVLFGKLRPYLAKAWLADRAGAAVGDFLVLRPKPHTDPRFLQYVLLSSAFLTPLVASTRGAKMPRTDWRAVRQSNVWLPTVGRQRTIVDFLDRETAQIDALIAQQQRFIALLEERKRGVLRDAFDEAPTTTLRRHVRTLRQGWSPNCESFPADGVREWGVLKLGCTRGGRFDAAENKRLPSDLTPRPEHVVRRGEVVMSRANTRDLVGVPAVVRGDYPRLMLSDLNYGITMRPTLDADFAVLSLLCPRTRRDIEARAKGTSPSMQKLSQRDILDLPLWVPDIPTQRSVVTKVGAQFARVDALIEQTWEHIALAKERRAALITAAVTGQIDVTRKVS